MASWTTPKTWAAATLTSSDMNTHVRDNLNFLKANIALGAASELTISGGIVTKTQSYHTIDTEADGATDDLDTINGGSAGDILIFSPNHTDRTVVVKTGTGNILCDADITLDTSTEYVVLIYDGTNWQLLAKRVV
jgi:hypothetical protein